MNTSSPAATAVEPLLTVEQLIDRMIEADDISQRERWADCLRLRIGMDQIMACMDAREAMIRAIPGVRA